MQIRTDEGKLIDSSCIVILRVCPVFHYNGFKFVELYEVWASLFGDKRIMIRSFTDDSDALAFKKRLERKI